MDGRLEFGVRIKRAMSVANDAASNGDSDLAVFQECLSRITV